MIICICKSINDKEITQCIKSGNPTVEEVCQQTGAGSQCGRCKIFIQSMIDKEVDVTLVDSKLIIKNTR